MLSRTGHSCLPDASGYFAGTTPVGTNGQLGGGEALLKLMLAYEDRTPEGEAKIKAEQQAMREAWAWAGMPINTQADMFADLAPIDERAFGEGEEAGLRGDTLANPYDLNSQPGRLYEAGWKSGQAKLAEGFKQKLEAASTDELVKGSEPGADNDDPFEPRSEAAE